ncbi:glycosyltransferase family 4 protein [Psychroserpens sp. SPM9]|uniref:glycosyltransferase family 4 protein n=1 Tax=Psychroserpens sp. SPM9 TaxID=2975598 RepID=UPI0021A327DB|nr:glycosyltransferase family 4 protein [Psychroserpens sp. SPM9]MDG5491111.1 glycosyltransferase family 4 protein [Psychroserpens sp. SPM9]
MKIIVLGTRGIPDILGGVETHCEELYPRISKLGHDVTIITRTPYVKDRTVIAYKGVRLKHIFAPKQKSIEAIIHTFLGVMYAGFKRPDVLHIHAVGPMIMTPLARLLGLKVVVTNHGPDYDRQKWGKLAKTILKLGESFGTRTAHKPIVISNVIKSILEKKYNRHDAVLIYNGVTIPKLAEHDDYIHSLGLEKHQYIIAVGRFVEEKGFSDLIKAYSNITTPYKLVLVGDADHETIYSKQLKKEAKEAGVILTGFIKGEQLHQIFSHAQLFVMPSYHEGLPIALLEAMSYNLNVLVSDIPANLEVALDESHYFEVGNIEAISGSILNALKHPSKAKIDNSKLILEKYNWDTIAEDTISVYKSL